jgi:hypothetical protein
MPLRRTPGDRCPLISSALNLKGCDLPLMANPLRIASRRSQLAMVQTN